MAKLNSGDIAAELADKMGISKKAAKMYTDFIFERIREHAEDGDEISILRFGKFRMEVTAPRNGTNVHSKEKIRIPAKTRLKFDMSRRLKDVYDKAYSSGEGAAE